MRVNDMARHVCQALADGAGVSTESDIPDYRSPTGAYSTGFKPMTHQEFMVWLHTPNV
jgi:NAD-dependent SIR2 family protein deacetylase